MYPTAACGSHSNARRSSSPPVLPDISDAIVIYSLFRIIPDAMEGVTVESVGVIGFDEDDPRHPILWDDVGSPDRLEVWYDQKAGINLTTTDKPAIDNTNRWVDFDGDSNFLSTATSIG